MLSMPKTVWMAAHPISAYRELKTIRKLAQSVPEFGETPWFDQADVALVSSVLDKERTVIEYGSGSSTLFFAQHALSVHSVDSSSNYVANVIAEGKRRGAANIHLSVANLGPVKDWGWPIDHFPTAGNIARWKSYLEAPWSTLPDTAPVGLIIIDGRFRTACAAYAIARSLIAAIRILSFSSTITKDGKAPMAPLPKSRRYSQPKAEAPSSSL